MLEKITMVYQWLQSPAGVALLLALVSISEILDGIPQLKASSIWKLAFDGLKFAKNKLVKKA